MVDILDPDGRQTAGILLLTVPLIELGGLFMLRVVRGRVPSTPFQVSFSRAGHAHAGVLVILGLVAQLLLAATTLEEPVRSIARSGIPLAAILMPAGFFLSSAGRGRTSPNRAILLVYVGAVSLGLGAVALGIGLLAAG